MSRLERFGDQALREMEGLGDCAIGTDDLWKGSRVVFLRAPDGDIAWLRTGRLHRRA
jgi:hypothetical protein